MKIVHQTQPTATSCHCTCLAMMLGKPAQQVIDEFQETYFSAPASFDTVVYILDSHDGVSAAIAPHDQGLDYEKVYIVTVPSLNFDGVFHSIVVDTRDGKVEIFDPAKGRPGKRYYVWQEGYNPFDDNREFTHEDPLAVPFFGFLPDLFVTYRKEYKGCS